MSSTTPNSTSAISPSQAERIRQFNHRYYLGRAAHWEQEAAKFAVLGQRACATLCECRQAMYLDLASEFAPVAEGQVAR